MQRQKRSFQITGNKGTRLKYGLLRRKHTDICKAHMTWQISQAVKSLLHNQITKLAHEELQNVPVNMV